MPPRVLFLPGASGAGQFWWPVAERLPGEWGTVFFDWPGWSYPRATLLVNSYADLAELVRNSIDTPWTSSPSLWAVSSPSRSLSRARRQFGVWCLSPRPSAWTCRSSSSRNWRAEYRAEYPTAAAFVTDPTPLDLSSELSKIQAPTLLLWAASDAISPPDVGRHLQSKLVAAQPKLVVLDRGNHMFARDYAADVAPLIHAHLV